MQVKASLHLHAKEDVKDGPSINYTIFNLIDRAQKLDIKVLAITGHESCICDSRHVEYGWARGLLVIPGIELKISGKHILVLNCEPSVEALRTLDDLIEYKKNHPEVFIIAPHPNYGVRVSLGLKKLRRFHQLFDAVEHSWYYSRWVNFNKKTASLCRELDLPFIATADVHDLPYLAGDYAILEIDRLDTSNVFAAIRAGHFSNVSQPKSLGEMFFYQIKMAIRSFVSLFR